MWDRHCKVTGKRSFTSNEQARKHTKTMSNRLKVYRCEFCRELHVAKAERDTALRDE